LKRQRCVLREPNFSTSRAQFVARGDRLLRGCDGAQSTRGIPHDLSRSQERADRRRSSDARHDRSHAGLSREIVKRALELGASAIILVHNHPSGDPTPSRADIEMTREVVAAAKALNIAVHDHLVVGRGGHASFKSLGLL